MLLGAGGHQNHSWWAQKDHEDQTRGHACTVHALPQRLPPLDILVVFGAGLGMHALSGMEPAEETGSSGLTLD